MTYGGTAPSITPSYSGFVNGQSASIVTGTTCSTTATAASAVGSYPSTCTGATAPNYTISTVNGSVSVTAAALTVTASSGTMTYGGTAPTITPSYSGFVNGQSASIVTGTTCSTTATAASAVGSYPSTCTGATAPNYTISTVNGSVSVTAAALTVTASSGTMTYGGTVPSITPSYSGFVNGQSASIVTGTTCSTTATAASAVGSYPSTCTGATAPNYTITPVNGTVSVTAAALTVTASSGTMTYGGTAPSITPSYSGFVNGNTAASLTTAPTCSTTATSHSPVGSYASSCAGAVDNNYTISYVAGTVTDSAAALVITASSGTMTYGGTVPAITASYSGFVNGDTAASLTTAPTCTTTATSQSAAGSFPSSCTGAVDSNYAISYVSGTVVDSPAPLTIAANNASMTQGSAIPTLTATYSGFVNGNGPSNLTGTLVCTTTATSSSAPGTYPITCSGQSSSNYTITYVAGTLTIIASGNLPNAPIASVSPTCISFGGVLIGTSCAPQPVTLTNVGTASLTISSIQITGPQASDFSQTNTCGTLPASLAAGAACTISVGFKPSTAGPETATLTITDNSSGVAGSMQTVGLSGAGSSQIKGNFNGTAIAAGNYIWFNSVFSPKNIPSSGSVTISVSNAQVTFSANGTNYTVPLPNSLITLSSSYTTATTAFDVVNNRWITTAPLSGLSGNLFLDAVPFQVPAGGLPGGINPVTWGASFTSDTPGVNLQWQWAAAVYLSGATNFSSPSTYNSIGVKPTDDNHASQYQNSDHAGTPENEKQYMGSGGATGGGGSNYTGSYSGTGSVTPAVSTVGLTGCLSFGNQTVGTTSAPVPVTLSNNSSTPVSISGVSTTGGFTETTNTCGTSLAPGATCTISVTYTPSAPGTTTGTLVITEGSGTQTVNLSGNGIVPGGGKTGAGCVYALSPTAPMGIDINGVNYTAKCGAVIDSNSSTALTTSGSNISATVFAMVGGDSLSGSNTGSTIFLKGIKPVSDPLASLLVPSVNGSCPGTNYSISGQIGVTVNPGSSCYNVSVTGSVNVTFNPGQYSSITVSGSTGVTFNPGLYIIVGSGGLNFGGTNVSASGVTFYLGPNAGPAVATGSNSSFVAPTTGTYAGIVFFQDRSNTTAASVGGSNAAVVGALYFPKAQLTYLGSNASSAYTLLVANTIVFSGSNSTLNDNYSSLPGGPPF
jgi:hypothetical protein